MINKKQPAQPSEEKAEIPLTPAPPPAPKSPTLEDIGKQIAREKIEGEAKLDTLEKELFAIRGSIGKLDLTSRSSREAQNQALQLLQQDADREIKFFERRLQEDMKHWDKQLKDREKVLQQSHVQSEAEQQKNKEVSLQNEASLQEAAERAEAFLKEQEAKLLAERQKWQTLLQSKEGELSGLADPHERAGTPVGG
jgi:hypothetical protein